MRRFIKYFLILSLVQAVLLPAVPAIAFDFSKWDALLKEHVRPTTRDGVRLNGIHYSQVARDPRYLETVSGLAQFSPDTLKGREEKLAFWINAYNLFAVKMVVDHYPVESIKDAGSLFSSVWKKTVGKVGGRDITLNEIEHEILRKMGEPRIHVAIVCASVSCPDLRAEAYTATGLDSQLDDQLRRFLENRGKGLKKEGGTVFLSSIFKWFAEDFESKGGVQKFLAPHAPAAVQPMLKSGNAELEYLDYNWKLNTL